MWARLSHNSLMESVSLPPGSSSECDGSFHQDLIPHLDACLLEHGALISGSILSMGKLKCSLPSCSSPP